MSPVVLILVIILIIIIFGGGYGYRTGHPVISSPQGITGLAVLVLVIGLILYLLRAI